MGWEVRHGRRYLYRNRRVNGKPVKEYLAADDRLGFGAVMAADLARVQAREAKVRKLERQTRAAFQDRVDGLLAAVAAAGAELRVVVEGVLTAAGFHRHHRGEWRMRREIQKLGALIDQLKGPAAAGPAVLIRYDAPADDPEAVELYAKARAGDAAAQDGVRELIRSRGWVDWVGDLGRQATRQLIHRATAGDPVWTAGVTEKANALRNQLLGDAPTVLDELLVRRVVNGWVAVHVLELELTLRPPTDRRSKEYLDRALTRAQKRMAEAVRELARVRRLALPPALTQVNLVTRRAVVNTAAPAATSTANPALGPVGR